VLPDSSEIDAALVAVLANDAQLKAIMPDGVYFDEAPPACRNFVIVSLFHSDDVAFFPARRSVEDLLYVVKGVSFGTSGATVKAAAARIDQLLENAALVVNGYDCMTVHREQRIRYPEVDAIDPSIRWQHRGGHYRVAMAIV
jgi:hypothetical protein